MDFSLVLISTRIFLLCFDYFVRVLALDSLGFREQIQSFSIGLGRRADFSSPKK